MRRCIQEGTLQAWFDNELNADEAANVAAHLRSCVQCAESARTAEAENQNLAKELTNVFASAVPTDRLRQRLNAAVTAIQYPESPAVTQSRWRFGLGGLTSFRSLAYASIAAGILFAGFVTFSYLKHRRATPAPAQTNLAEVLPATSPSPIKQGQQIQKAAQFGSGVNEKREPRVKRGTRTAEPDAMSLSWQESQYRYAIAKLTESIRIQPPLRPSVLVEYEYNMAVINNEIATRRDVARKNPNDPIATQSMLTAYQSKVDLLNEVSNVRVLEK